MIQMSLYLNKSEVGLEVHGSHQIAKDQALVSNLSRYEKINVMTGNTNHLVCVCMSRSMS